MSTAGSVPVFAGKKSLALGVLDELGNVVRDNAAMLRTSGRKGRTGYAHAGNAWYVPEPVPGVGESKDFTAEVPGLLRGVEFSGQFKRCIVEDGMMWLPHAHMEHAVDEDTGEESVTRTAGGVLGIEPRAESPATIDEGVIVLPLAQSEETETDEESGATGVVTSRRAGLLYEVRVKEGLEAPALKEGSLQLPLAEWDSAAGVFDRPGLIRSVELAANESLPSIKGGVLRIPQASQVGVPLAEYDPAGGTATAGIVAGVVWTNDSTPSIKSGVLQLPRAGGGGGGTVLTAVKAEDTSEDAGRVDGSTLRLDFADHDTSAGILPKAGLVNSIEMCSGGSPRIDNGRIIVPTHSFDPTQFTVSNGGLVQLINAPVAGLAGLYDAEHNRRLTWADLKGAGPVRLSYSSGTSMGITAMMFGDFLSLYIDTTQAG